jgi:ABC-2 type transport system permease protein
MGLITGIKNILQHRELLFYLAIRELKIRYKYPILGFLWMLIVPFSMAVIFKVVFSLIIRIDIAPYPFFIFLISSVFAWNYFALTLSQTTTSLVDNSNLIKKVYFPREIIPLSILIGNLMTFIPAILLILVILLIFRIKIGVSILFLPFAVLVQTLFMSGLVLITSSLQVLYRDVKYIVEILILLWFYLTPIFYPLSLVEQLSPQFLKIYMFNPLTCLITLYRLVLLPGFISTLPKGINVGYLVNYTIFVSLLFFIWGLFVFRRYDARVSDFV